VNRKGWPKDILDLPPNSSQRGEYKVAYLARCGLAAIQWKDTKIVNCIASYLDFEVGECHRQVGSEKKQFPCPGALQHYQKNMGGVDKADQMRTHFAGFASVSHFKKWYKKADMAVLDCMLLNGLILWNMVCDKVAD